MGALDNSSADRDPALEWQEHALCAQTDPEAFFPEKGAAPAKQSAFASHAKSAQIASNMPSLTMSVLVFGVACPNVNVAGSRELDNQIVAGSWLYCPPFL